MGGSSALCILTCLSIICFVFLPIKYRSCFRCRDESTGTEIALSVRTHFNCLGCTGVHIHTAQALQGIERGALSPLHIDLLVYLNISLRIPTYQVRFWTSGSLLRQTKDRVIRYWHEGKEQCISVYIIRIITVSMIRIPTYQLILNALLLKWAFDEMGVLMQTEVRMEIDIFYSGIWCSYCMDTCLWEDDLLLLCSIL